MSKSPSSKADTAVKLVLIFFISLLSFSVGTYVGKQVSESEARQAALEADYNGDSHAGDGEEATLADESTEPISDEEASTLAEEFVKSERKVASEGSHEGHGEAARGEENAEHVNAATHGEKESHSDGEKEGYTHRSKMNADNHEQAIAATEAPQHTTGHHAAAPTRQAAAEQPTKAMATETSKAATRIANDMAPAADPKKVAPAPTTLPTVATTAIGKYTVQVASYATETEAKEQASKLTAKGYSAFYVPAEVSGKTWYRVSVGLFADQKSATNYRTELLATQAVASAIVQKIVK